MRIDLDEGTCEYEWDAVTRSGGTMYARLRRMKPAGSTISTNAKTRSASHLLRLRLE